MVSVVSVYPKPPFLPLCSSPLCSSPLCPSPLFLLLLLPSVPVPVQEVDLVRSTVFQVLALLPGLFSPALFSNVPLLVSSISFLSSTELFFLCVSFSPKQRPPFLCWTCLRLTSLRLPSPHSFAVDSLPCLLSFLGGSLLWLFCCCCCFLLSLWVLHIWVKHWISFWVLVVLVAAAAFVDVCFWNVWNV